MIITISVFHEVRGKKKKTPQIKQTKKKPSQNNNNNKQKQKYIFFKYSVEPKYRACQIKS